ncbi:hypothetical protein Mapa_000156 [Marchantia paleacea]|nr:hypothetical protein Mapa_000156 [Marchantia paleacea]
MRPYFHSSLSPSLPLAHSLSCKNLIPSLGAFTRSTTTSHPSHRRPPPRPPAGVAASAEKAPCNALLGGVVSHSCRRGRCDCAFRAEDGAESDGSVHVSKPQDVVMSHGSLQHKSSTKNESDGSSSCILRMRRKKSAPGSRLPRCAKEILL